MPRTRQEYTMASGLNDTHVVRTKTGFIVNRFLDVEKGNKIVGRSLLVDENKGTRLYIPEIAKYAEIQQCLRSKNIFYCIINFNTVIFFRQNASKHLEFHSKQKFPITGLLKVYFFDPTEGLCVFPHETVRFVLQNDEILMGEKLCNQAVQCCTSNFFITHDGVVKGWDGATITQINHNLHVCPCTNAITYMNHLSLFPVVLYVEDGELATFDLIAAFPELQECMMLTSVTFWILDVREHILLIQCEIGGKIQMLYVDNGGLRVIDTNISENEYFFPQNFNFSRSFDCISSTYFYKYHPGNVTTYPAPDTAATEAVLRSDFLSSKMFLSNNVFFMHSDRHLIGLHLSDDVCYHRSNKPFAMLCKTVPAIGAAVGRQYALTQELNTYINISDSMDVPYVTKQDVIIGKATETEIVFFAMKNEWEPDCCQVFQHKDGETRLLFATDLILQPKLVWYYPTLMLIENSENHFLLKKRNGEWQNERTFPKRMHPNPFNVEMIMNKANSELQVGDLKIDCSEAGVFKFFVSPTTIVFDEGIYSVENGQVQCVESFKRGPVCHRLFDYSEHKVTVLDLDIESFDVVFREFLCYESEAIQKSTKKFLLTDWLAGCSFTDLHSLPFTVLDFGNVY
ncbi:hypothetical protein PCE1_004649 [Barthelona sp. PCE]